MFIYAGNIALTKQTGTIDVVDLLVVLFDEKLGPRGLFNHLTPLLEIKKISDQINTLQHRIFTKQIKLV